MCASAGSVFAQEARLLLYDDAARFAAQGNARGHVKRTRSVTPDLESLAIPDLTRGRRHVERRITANLFPDVMLPVKLEDVERDLIDTIVWTGRVSGDPESNVTIAINGVSMTASFNVRDHAYAIQARPNGAHEALEIDQTGFPDEQPPPALLPSYTAATSVMIAANDIGTTWDVFVAYTNIVRAYYGSASAVQSLISNAVVATNTAYANSRVTPRLRLVGTMEVTYDDQTTTFSTTLSRLRSTSDGYLDEVHTQRNALGADAVTLLVYNPTDNFCGIGYLMTAPPGGAFAAYAFNVVRDDCAVDNFSFAHELGHNFGLEHDRANAGPSPNPSYPWAFGYQDTASLFRDIMSYNCPTGCPRIQYFSNPDVMYLGRPLGVNYLLANAADNARALNTNASIIANWRSTVVPAVTFTDDPLVTGVTPIKAIHLTEVRDAVNSLRAQAGLTAATWTDPTPAGSLIRAVHITELRSALTPVLATIGTTATYTDPLLAAGMVVKAVHIQELRNYTK
jgi:hypothetical protein